MQDVDLKRNIENEDKAMCMTDMNTHKIFLYNDMFKDLYPHVKIGDSFGDPNENINTKDRITIENAEQYKILLDDGRNAIVYRINDDFYDLTKKSNKISDFMEKYAEVYTNPHQFNEIISNAFKVIMEYTDVERICFNEFKGSGFTVIIEEKCCDEIATVLGRSFNYDLYKNNFFKQNGDGYICYYDAEYENEKYRCIAEDVKSIFIIPLDTLNGTIGFLSLVTVTHTAEWDEDDFRIFKMAAPAMATNYSGKKSDHDMLVYKNRLEFALKASGSGIWEISVQDKMIAFDEGFSELLHIPFTSPAPLSAFADHLAEITDMEQYGYVVDYYKNHFDGSKALNFRNKKYTFRDGSVAYISTDSKVHYDENGKPDYTIGMVRNVTDDVLYRLENEQMRKKHFDSQEFISKFTLPFTQPENIDNLMNNALLQIESYFQTDRICIQIIDESRTFLCCKYEKISSEKVPSVLNAIHTMDELEILFEQMKVKPYLYFNDTTQLFEDVPKVNYSAKSSLLIPMIAEKITVGYMTFDWLWYHNHCDESDLQLAQLISSVIAGAYYTHSSTMELLKSKTEVERTQERLQLALTSANLGVWEIDVNANLFSFDEGTRKLFNLKKPSPMTLNEWADELSEIIDNEEYGEYIDFIRSGYKSKKYYAVFDKIEEHMPDGRIQYTTHKAKRVYDENGYIVRIIGVTWDITEDVLLVEKLKQSTHQAAEASRAKSDFLSRMSHEIRTPMNAIIGMTQLSDTTADSLKLKGYIENIKLSSQQLLSVINDVLDISKIESGKVIINNDPFMLEKLIYKACSLISDNVYSKKLSFEYKPDENLKLCYYGDEMHLLQIIINLLSNAVKFTNDGGKITISIINEILTDVKYENLIITVTDTGIGMTDEQCERVWESFEQANLNIAEHYGGTGLGLSICKKLVEKMNGTIEVKSILNVGSEFVVKIPMMYAENFEQNLIDDVKNKTADFKTLVATKNSDIIGIFTKLKNMLGWHIDIVSDEDDFQLDYAQNVYMYGQTYNSVFVDTDILTSIMRKRLYSAKDTMPKGSTIYMTDVGEWNNVHSSAWEYDICRHMQKPVTVYSIFETVSELVKRTDNADIDVADFSRKSILLVEDIEINRQIIISLLEYTNITIDEAVNGLDAIEMLNQNTDKYDLILMDIQMPVMNGIDAAQIIRNLDFKSAKTVPIIALTANAFKEDVEACIKAGMNGHIAKPIDINEVIAVIKAFT